MWERLRGWPWVTLDATQRDAGQCAQGGKSIDQSRSWKDVAASLDGRAGGGALPAAPRSVDLGRRKEDPAYQLPSLTAVTETTQGPSVQRAMGLPQKSS